MQEQEKMEIVWQAPELVELGNIAEGTQLNVVGAHNDGGTNGSSHS